VPFAHQFGHACGDALAVPQIFPQMIQLSLERDDALLRGRVLRGNR
jgi:hypothetical protein